MTPPSPPSPPSPWTPPEVIEARVHARLLADAEIERKKLEIGITGHALKYFTQTQFISGLSNMLSDPLMSLEKRYLISDALSTIFKNLNLQDADIRNAVNDVLVCHTFNPQSKLYQALNSQSNWPYITIRGAMKLFSYNCSRPLQTIQSYAKHDAVSVKLPRNYFA